MRYSTKLIFFNALIFAGLVSGVAHAQAPSITATTPAANAGSVANNAAVNISFAQPVSAINAARIKFFGNQRTGLRAGITSGAGTNTLTFQPTLPFAPGELIRAVVPGTVASTAKTWQFSAAAPQGTGTFTAVPDLITGFGYCNNARTIAADLNGDGNLDLLNVNSINNSVGIYLNAGAGQFGAPTYVSVLLAPRDVAVADIDNDGDLDLLCPSYHVGYGFSFRLNNGTGQFSGGGDIMYPYGFAPDRITTADVNADGYLDIITGNSSTDNSIGICHNNGNGTFAPVMRFAVANPRQVATGDINGDGAVDILVLSGYSSSSSPSALVPFLNDGTGNFSATTAIPFTQTYNLNGLQTSDVDGDGDLDALVSYAASNNGIVAIELNDGAGHFTSGQRFAIGTSNFALAVGDVDGDGDIDFIANSYLSGPSGNPDILSVGLNDGTGWFYNAPNVSVSFQTLSLELADVNGDGALDVIGPGSNGVIGIRLGQAAQPTFAISPGQGSAGNSVLLTGTGLQGTTSVRFNGTLASGFVVNPAGTSITVTVPAGAKSGRVALTKTQGTAFSATSFLVLSPTATRNEASNLITDLYPNPAQKNVSLALASSADVVKLELLDLTGRSVMHQVIPHPAIKQPLNVNLAGIKSGIYCLRVTSGTTSVARRLEIQ